MNYLLFALSIATIAGQAPHDAGDDGLGFGAFVDDASIEIVGERVSSKTNLGAYLSSASNWEMSERSDVTVAVDRIGAFCVSDAQSGICVPDATFADPDEESSEPSVVDIVSAASQQVERDIARLGVAAARVNIQPASGEALINIETVFYTAANTQHFSTSVLGRQVLIEVTPATFMWDFGDGSPELVTSDPGAPYPNHTISHTYDRAGEHYISLRTTWNARFRVEGVSNWLPVTGQPVTVDQMGPLQTVAKINRLVPVP